MAPKEYDVAVIGSGPGGYVAAIRCAQLGLKTAVVEKEALGGVCLNWGCIPTKALIRTAEHYHHMKKNPGGIFQYDRLDFDWSAVIAASRKTTDQMSKGVEFLMKKNKIDVLAGAGRFKSKDLLAVTDASGAAVAEVKAKNFIVATGARPSTLPGVEIDGKIVIGSRQAMVLPEQPKSIAIVGGGVIGLEFAYFFAAMGTQVTVLEYAPQVLPANDEEVSKTLERSFKKLGVNIVTGAAVKNVWGEPGDAALTYERNGKSESVKAQMALMAVGVRPNVENLGLEEIGVKLDRGGIVANDQCQSSVANIYAIGDVIGQPALAHAASAEGILAAEAIAGKKPQPIDYDNVPACVYCQPQVASVGLTEKAAREKGYDVHVAKFDFRVNGKSVAIGEIDGFVKLVADKKYGEILGAHIIGSEATEMIAELTLARANELTIHEIHHTVHAHPTQSEAVLEAAGVWLGHPIHI